MFTHYDFVTRWRVKATCEEVSEILSDALDLKRWWPAVYLDVSELKPGDPDTGVGRQIALYTKGWLPYTLRWTFTVTENRRPHGFTLPRPATSSAPASGRSPRTASGATSATTGGSKPASRCCACSRRS